MSRRREFDWPPLLAMWLLAAAATAFFGEGAFANPLIHMKRTVWGCVDPNVTPDLNDDRDPRRSDPQWVARTSAVGQCVTISPQSIWEPLSPNYNGLTYVAYRGKTGRPGSFWVPTAAIDFTEPLEVIPPPPSPRPEASPAPAPELAAAAAPRVAPVPPQVRPASLQLADTVAQVSVAPVPAQATVSGSAEDPNSRSGSFGGGIAILLVLLGGASVIRRSVRRGIGSGGRPAASRQTVKSAPSLDRIRNATTAERARRVTSKVSGTESSDDMGSATIIAGNVRLDVQSPHPTGKTTSWSGATNSDFWHPPGGAVTVAGATVADGMVYVGRSSGRSSNHDASLIDPALPVARSSASAGPLGYWPSYGAITPECRRRYLEWLASGKQAPDADIGYVFLYFYGLERRLLLEKPAAEEVRTLVGELRRLRAIYAGNKSFDGYSRRLIEVIAFLQDAAVTSSSLPDLADPSSEMPIALKVAIAREVMSGRPLSFELATAAIFGLKEFWSARRRVLEKGRPAFLAVFRARFATAFPTGFLLRNRKDSRLQIVYRGASARLEVDLASRLAIKDLPDPTTLTWTKLLALAAAVAEEITPYAKVLSYHPARANSLAGLISCPTELRDSVAPEARSWLVALPSPAAVTFGELAGHAIGTTTAKWTIRHRRQVSEALSILGYAMEPDPEDGMENIEDNTVVQVFKYPGGTSSRAMEVACAAAMFVAAVGRTVDGKTLAAAEHWLSMMPSRLSLTSEQTTRLRARLIWLSTKSVTLAKAKKLLGEATTDEKEFCAWSATVATGATGDVGKPQVAVLEAIHDALAVPRGALYAGLHAGIGMAATAANEPILVSDEVQEALHPIPRPATVAPVDLGRLDRIRAETERVSAMLAEIFVEEEPSPQATEQADGGLLAGLDVEHAALLTRLLLRAKWSRDEFDGAASEIGLMPDGAMETINEWSFDHHGDAVLEDGEQVVVNRALVPSGSEAAAVE